MTPEMAQHSGIIPTKELKMKIINFSIIANHLHSNLGSCGTEKLGYRSAIL
jgi:hypothetical protein